MFPVRKVVTDIIDVSVTLFKNNDSHANCGKAASGNWRCRALLNHVLSPVMGVPVCHLKWRLY